MTPEEAQAMAEAHWKWLEALLHKVYVDAFIHGAKHAADAKRNHRKKEKLP